jgi:hypothetical protein
LYSNNNIFHSHKSSNKSILQRFNKFKAIVIVPPYIISHSNNNNDNENQSRDKDITQSDFSGTIEKVGRDLQIPNEIGMTM